MIDISCDCWEDDNYDCECRDYQIDAIMGNIAELKQCKPYGFTDDRQSLYYGESFKVVTYQDHSGDYLVIDFEYAKYDVTALDEINYERAYNNLCRNINKLYPVSIGHGWTSSQYAINQLFA